MVPLSRTRSSAKAAYPFSGSHRRRVSARLMGWSSSSVPSRVQGAATRISTMLSPPMPAMTTVSASPGAMSRRPSHSRSSIRSATPHCRAVRAACSRGSLPMSEAMAPEIRPSSSSAAGI